MVANGDGGSVQAEVLVAFAAVFFLLFFEFQFSKFI